MCNIVNAPYIIYIYLLLLLLPIYKYIYKLLKYKVFLGNKKGNKKVTRLLPKKHILYRKTSKTFVLCRKP